MKFKRKKVVYFFSGVLALIFLLNSQTKIRLKKLSLKFEENSGESSFSLSQNEGGQSSVLKKEEAMPTRKIASVDVKDLLKDYVPESILEKSDVKVLDSDNSIMRLGLTREGLAIEGSEFIFRKNKEEIWQYVDGRWTYPDLDFPSLKSSLNESQVLKVVESSLPAERTNLKFRKLKEYWRLYSNDPQQLEVWRIEYRDTQDQWIRENYKINVSSETLVGRSPALRD